MVDLKTDYAGLVLNNPIIVSSSGLTDKVEKIKELELLGAGAVVLKSLFEEQIMYQTGHLAESSDYPEAEDYIRYYTRHNSVDQYLRLIEKAKAEVDIPVIASVNCISSTEWIDFSRKIEEAGADAIELNVYFLPVNKEYSGQDYEKIYFELAANIKELISIPLIMKLGSNFTNLVNMVDQLYFRGVAAVVLFNRFYAPDIQIDQKKIVSADVFSLPTDIRHSLRWVAIVSGQVDQIHVAASTGIHDGEAVIKQLMAGAQAIQICSTLYNNGVEYLSKIIRDLTDWMIKMNYRSIDEFRGMMNYGRIKDPAIYERSQFMKYFSNHH